MLSESLLKIYDELIDKFTIIIKFLKNEAKVFP